MLEWKFIVVGLVAVVLAMVGLGTALLSSQGPSQCEQLEMYCIRAQLKGDASGTRQCDIVRYHKPDRSPGMCRSLLEALQKAEMPDD